MINREIRIYPRPNPNDQEEFLIELFFGIEGDYLDRCVARAYRDFNRTLRGVAKLESKNSRALYYGGGEIISRQLGKLKSFKVTQETFDQWHHIACQDLRNAYAKGKYKKFSFGQAQKWLNMTYKYIQVMGETRIPGYSIFYPFAHVPIDRIVLKQFKRKFSEFSPPKLSVESWSRLDDYEEYMEYQRWIRNTFSGSAPLAVEFIEWPEAMRIFG